MGKKVKNSVTINLADEVRSSTNLIYVDRIIEDIVNNKIYIDPNFQRRDAWTLEDRKEFIDSVYKNMVSNSIILVNVIASHQKAKFHNRHKEIEYFGDLVDKGYEYVSIDGNNRSQTLVKYHKDELNIVYSHDKDREIFLRRKQLPLTVYDSMTLEQMHELGIKINKGKPWNRQEQRNCLYSTISFAIREVSEKYSDITDKINQIKKSRMGDDELLVMLLYYQTYKRGGVQDSWDVMYERESGDVNTFTKVMMELGKTLRSTDKKNIDKSFVYNLYMVLSYLQKNNISVKKDSYSEFFKVFHKQEVLRKADKRALYEVNGEQKTWGDLCRLIATNVDYRLEKILNELLPKVSKITVEKDTKRTFTLTDKIEIWNKSKGDVRVNGKVDGKWFNSNDKTTHTKLSLLEVLDGKKYVVDHIKPHKDGSKTVIENGEITTKEYNLWKSDGKPNYV